MAVPSVVAMVEGKPLTEIPKDLFIPPDALEVLLDSFNGPLDLLLYLIRRQNLDIINIPMALITEQYLQYIQIMKEKRMELAADYLVMAALLIEIKSRMLLPVPPSEDDKEEEDPRMALIRRLQAYEQFKHAAEQLDALPRYERDVFHVQAAVQNLLPVKIYPHVELQAVVTAMRNILQKQSHRGNHQITREPFCVQERMGIILQRLLLEETVNFSSLLARCEGRVGLVITFLAVLELSRQSLLVILQVSNFSPIHLQAIRNE
jgi:segregation and condensation protein A